MGGGVPGASALPQPDRRLAADPVRVELLRQLRVHERQPPDRVGQFDHRQQHRVAGGRGVVAEALQQVLVAGGEV